MSCTKLTRSRHGVRYERQQPAARHNASVLQRTADPKPLRPAQRCEYFIIRGLACRCFSCKVQLNLVGFHAPDLTCALGHASNSVALVQGHAYKSLLWEKVLTPHALYVSCTEHETCHRKCEEDRDGCDEVSGGATSHAAGNVPYLQGDAGEGRLLFAV